jgi:hypothetical protein
MICFGNGAITTTFVKMPKATVNKNGSFISSKYNVRATSKILAMYTET